MKTKMFKIRSISSDDSPRNTTNNVDNKKQATSCLPEVSQIGERENFNQFMDIFKTFMKESNRKNKTTTKSFQLEARDREVIIDLPERQKYNGKIFQDQLKRWTARVIKTVSSAAFHYFSRNQMSFEQAKIYCSENIFRNIVLLAQESGLSAKQIQVIDTHIKVNILDYLAAKYPQTDSTEINKKLEENVHQIDNIDSLNNNYFTHTDLVFEYREDGNYNDLIMRMMNDIINLADKQIANPKESKSTNLGYFTKFMTNVFQKVEDEGWMKKQDNEQVVNQNIQVHNISSKQVLQIKLPNQNSTDFNQRIQKHKQQKQKYCAKVRENRKIPQNTPTYSKKEIDNMNMDIKRPFILRILSDWCDQLWYKYETGSYYTNRSESIKVQRGDSVNSLLAWMRRDLDRRLKQEKKEIQKFMQELKESNYEIQANIIQQELNRKDPADEYLEQIQRIRGKLSLKTANNLNQCLISLLNKLIHGLLKAAKQMHDENQLNAYSFWPSPANLLTFRSGNIMQSNISSKQKEIIRIYKELQRISREAPQKLRIVSSKNLLRTNNNLLLNVIFNNNILCEIKLTVTTQTYDFIKCNNLFHHYLGELKRSHFGPLTQLCSIWRSLDRKIQIFQELIDADNLKPQHIEHTCKKFGKKFQMVKHERSFMCGQCSQTYFHNNYLRQHTKCHICGFFVCARCKLREENEEMLISSLIINPALRKQCTRSVAEQEQLPKFGVCVQIESKIPKAEIFTHIIQQNVNKQYIVGRNSGEIYEIQSIAKVKDLRIFRSKYIVFELNMNSQQFSAISDGQANTKYILPVEIKRNYLKQKQSISLMDQNLTSYQCSQILSVGTSMQREVVKNLFLADNCFNQLPFDPQKIPNLSWLTLSRNAITNFAGLQKCNNLTNFIGVSCYLQTIPTQFFSLTNLQKLSLSANKIKQIPNQIANLTKLSYLQIEGNELTCLPQSLCDCLNLQHIDVRQNHIKSLPENIHQLHKLTTLICNKNQIEKLPGRIGDLKKLKEINISENQSFSALPDTFYSLENLQILDVSMTSLDRISEEFGKLTNLKQIKFSKCSNIVGPPSSINQLKNLQTMDFGGLYQMQLPKNIWNLTSLKNINLSRCNIIQLHRQFKYLKKMETLNLSSNQLGGGLTDLYEYFTELRELIIDSNNHGTFPKLSNCRKLVKLTLSHNAVTQIPNQIIENLINLQQLRVAQNQLQYFPPSITKLSNLVIFEATSNRLHGIIKQSQLQEVKASTNSMWPNLQQFLFNNNNLTEIPSILFKSTKLINLFLSKNQIDKIPHQIGSLSCLKNIDLNYNQVEELPIELSQINSLQGIYISYNRIKVVPAHLQNSTSIKNFHVDGCPIEIIQAPEWFMNNGVICGQLYAHAQAVIKEKERMEQNIINSNEEQQRQSQIK